MHLDGAEIDAEVRLQISADRGIERFAAAPNHLARADGSRAGIGADVPRQRSERYRPGVACRLARNGAGDPLGHPLGLTLGRVATFAHTDAAALCGQRGHVPPQAHEWVP